MAAEPGRGLKIHYRQLRDATAARQHELDAAAGQAVDFTDIRQRLAWVLAGLRHQRARESDLIHEAYYGAPFGPIFPGTPLTSYPAGDHREDRPPGAAAVPSPFTAAGQGS